jgi:hypothetical protein
MRGSVTDWLLERFEEATVPIRVKVMKKGELPSLAVIVRLLPPLAASRFSSGSDGESLQTFAATPGTSLSGDGEMVGGMVSLDSIFTSQALAVPDSDTFASRKAFALAVSR